MINSSISTANPLATEPSSATKQPKSIKKRKEFRLKRHLSQYVFKNLPIFATINDAPVDVRNISMTGACVRTRTQLKQENELNLLVKENDGEILLDEKFNIRWSQTEGIISDYGIQFDDVIDLDDLRNSSQSLLEKKSCGADHRVFFNNLPDDYKLLSSELLHHLSSLKLRASALENKFSISSIEEKQELAHMLIEDSGPAFQDIWYRFNDLTLTVSRNEPSFQAMKWHTENVIRPYFMDAPVWKRSWDKPLGYPGDFKIMLYAYDSDQYVECPSLYDAVVHGYLAHTLGECIRGRMHIVIKNIQDRIREVAALEQEPLNILNLGCGAARELPILFESKSDFHNKSVNIELLDQDEIALQYALELAVPHAKRCSPTIDIKAVDMPLIEMVRGSNDNDQPLDVVYSLGLIDYLPLAMAKRVARHFYDRLKPGGIISWCNVSTNRETCYWPLEFITDWTLHYRDENTMLEMFDFPDADVNLEIESSNQIWVISAKKPR